MFVNVDSSSAMCAEALRGAMAALCIFDWASWEATLEHAANDFAMALCTALRAEPLAPAAVADAGAQAGEPMCDASSTMGSGMLVREVGCTATFSAAGIRLVSKETQAQPRLVNRNVQAQAECKDFSSTTVAAMVSVAHVGTSCAPSVVDASTCHYLVPGVGLLDCSVQTEVANHIPTVPQSELEALQEALSREFNGGPGCRE